MILDIYNKDIRYYEGYESFCFQNCVSIVLNYYNINYSPLYIDSSLGLLMEYDKTNKQIKFRDHNNMVIPEYGHKIKWNNYSCNDDPISIFKENISLMNETKCPLIIKVDVYYLPYWWQKNHGSHYLILCGYCEINNLVYVIDWYEPWFYKGTIPLDKFLLARNSLNPNDGSRFSGEPIKNGYSIIDPSGWNKSLEELFYIDMKSSYNQYFKVNNNDVCGINILPKIKEIVFSKSCSLGEKLSYCKDSFYGIRLNSKRHILFKQFIESYLSYTNSNAIRRLIFLLTEKINSLNVLYMMFYKANLTGSESIDERILQRINGIIELDKELEAEINKFCS